VLASGLLLTPAIAIAPTETVAADVSSMSGAVQPVPLIGDGL